MKNIYKTLPFRIFVAVCCIGLILFQASCERVYEAPPLAEPVYEGASANKTIAALKAEYASISTATAITEDYIIRAVVSGNDISGNIYKQLYIQDETAAINIGVDQNSMYTTYRAGQEIYINLKGLSMVMYGGELQIGYAGTNANRIAWEIFNEHVSLNGWPKEASLEPLEIDLANLDASMVNKLVVINDVRFVNEGKNNFTSNDATTNESVKDLSGNTLDVRSSSYSSFANNILPTGKGTLVGLLGRYNGSWQLFLRDENDVKNFDGSAADDTTTPTDPDNEIIFQETFGDGTYASGNRPKIAEFTDFDMKSPVTYTEESGSADIRTGSGINASLWFPASKDITLKIAGIATNNATGLTLSFQLMSSVYEIGASANLNAMKVKMNGVSYTIPSTLVTIGTAADRNQYYTITISDIATAATSTLEFSIAGADNVYGMRMDNIIIKKASDGSSSGSSDAIVVTKD
ncbi:DUF5689 domain-containing protein [Sphingobacterium sp. LRF_L2]|uniref:DUF5689 domain-containing protein n=1 Tax=Sphingobacterium sp. LRF_L2 TaxID=3369421 RepID=UPI003F5F0F6C